MSKVTSMVQNPEPPKGLWERIRARVRVWVEVLLRGGAKPVFMVENTRGRKVEVLDALGNRINYVAWYNPNTREAELYLVGGIYQERPRFIVTGRTWGKNHVARTRVKLPGSSIVVDGTEY